MKTFELWLIESELDEGFLDSMKQGFQQSYQQTKQQNQQADSQNLEKFANVAVPAIKRATAFAGMLSQKTGVPLPLATALIASGLTGGPAAIPLAALLYFVKKPLMKGASNVFDAGVNAYNSGDFQKGVANFKQGFVNGAARNPINTLPTGSAPKVAQPNAWNAGLARMGRQGSMQPEHLVSFKNYCLYQEGFGDWAGQKIGSLAGKLSGNVVSAGQKAGNLLKQNLPKLMQFASQNKLAIGKAAFLMGCGALVGYGIGKLTNAAMDAITQNMTHAGVSPQEVSGIRRDLGLEDQSHGSNTEVSPGSESEKILAALKEKPLHGWNNKLGNFQSYQGQDGNSYFQGERGEIYRNYRGSSNQIEYGKMYQKFNTETGQWGRPSGITDHMRRSSSWTSN